jgi:iron complex outermembrane receptor protein
MHQPRYFLILEAALLLLIIGASAAAQTVGAQGILSGTVKDPSGAVIQGGQIEIRDLESGLVKSTLSDKDGRYAFEALTEGRYSASAMYNGFEMSMRRDIKVTSGKTTVIDFLLAVKAQRTSVVVTGRNEFDSPREISGDTAQMLDEEPGVSLYGNGGISSLPAIHGMADDRVRIKVDGMDLISACANHMNPPLSYIDPSNVGSIKVFAGITPVSMGGDSIGGTISVNSPAPIFGTDGLSPLVKARVGAFYRSNGEAYGATLETLFASDVFNMTYNGSISHSDDFRAAKDFKDPGLAAIGRGLLDGNEIGSSRYESQNHALGFALRHENHLFELTIGLQRIPYQGFPNQRMDMTANDSMHGNFHYTGKHQWGVLEARGYIDYTRHKMDFGNDKQFFYGSAATILAPGMPMDTKGLNLGAQVKADILHSKRDMFRLGIEAQRYHLNDWWPPSPSVLPPGYTTGGMAPNTFLNINNGRRDRIAVYAEWEARWDSEWTSLVGVRNETVLMNTGAIQGYNNGMMYNGAPLYPATTFNARDRKRTDDNVDVTALSRYTPDKTLDFEAGYAMKTRSPNLYERYAWSTNSMAMEMVNFAGDGNFYTGNLDLKPETAHTFSATASWHAAAKEERGIAITPYYTYVQDYIDARRCPTTVCGSSAAVVASTTATRGFVYLQFVNQSSRLFGVDISGRSVLAKTNNYGRFDVAGVVNLVRGENRMTGDNLYNIMPVTAKLSLVHSLGKWTNTIEDQLVGNKEQLSQVRNELRTGGYSLLNLRTSYEWKKTRFDVGLENTLNKYYSSPLGGAYVGQGPTMSSTAIPWGIPVPGMGRSFYARMMVALGE